MNARLSSACIVMLALLAGQVCGAEMQPPTMPPGGWKFVSLDLRGKDREAAMMLSFTVKADGSLADITPLDGFYDDVYALIITGAIKGKKMLPATVDGVPMDYHGYQMLVRVNLQGGMGTGPGFGQRYQQATALVKAGQVEAGAQAIEDLIAHHISSNYEFAFLNAALVPIYSQLGRAHDALRVSYLATMREGAQEPYTPTGSLIAIKMDPTWRYTLSREVVPTLLRQQFVLADALHDNSAAINAYRQLAAISKMTDDDPMAIRARTLQQRLMSAEPISSLALIRGGAWRYHPARRVFSVPDVQGGALKSVQLQCSFHQQELPFSTEAEWVLQPSWGNCAVTFKGDEGTRFAVLETVAPSP